MYEEEDRQFFDELYQLWSKTTGAGDGYWMPERHEGKSVFYLQAVNRATDEKKRIASYLSDEDAEFIASLHGAVPELIRRLHEAIDEAVRKDEANDEAQAQLAETLLENQALREEIRSLERELEGKFE